MPISDAKKAYRKTAAEIEKRRLYAAEYRKRQATKDRDKKRAASRRAAPGGAEKNRALVKRDRLNLGRMYVAALLANSIGIPSRSVPNVLVDLKREALLLSRTATQMINATTKGEQSK